MTTEDIQSALEELNASASAFEAAFVELEDEIDNLEKDMQAMETEVIDGETHDASLIGFAKLVDEAEEIEL